MDEEEQSPSEDDLIGKNGAYHQSIAILHHGLNEMGRELSEIKLSSGNGMEVHGQFPSFVTSIPNGRGGRDNLVVTPKADYQLQPKFSGSSIRFVPYEVWGYGVSGEEVAFMPTIGGFPIDDVPPPTLTVETEGAIFYFRHTFTWNGDGIVTTEGIEIVQSKFSIPVTNSFQTSSGFGTSSEAGNITYLMFSAYNENKVVVADLVGEYWAGYFDTPLRSVRQAATPNLSAPSASFGL